MENALIRPDVLQILESVPELERLSGKRILITGGTGFIGCWLLETLLCMNERLSTPCQAVIVSRSPERFRDRMPHLAYHRNFQFVTGDIIDLDYRQIPAVDFVIHAAAPADPVQLERNALQIVRTIVTGTDRLLLWAAEQKMTGFLLLSSGAVYGDQPSELQYLPESFTGILAPGNHRAAYAEAKRMAELLCTIYRQKYGLPLRIARLFTLVGPYQSLDAGFAVTDFIRDALRGQPLYIAGDGTPLRSYAYAAEITGWLWAILLRAEAGSIYNAGSDRAISIRELAEQVAAAMQRRGRIISVQQAKQPASGVLPARYVPDISCARSELDLSLSIELPEALDKMLAWFSR